MPNYTSKLNLKLPLASEYYNIEDFNNNFGIIDNKVILKNDLPTYFGDLINDGVVNLSTDFLITYNGDLTIDIGQGAAWYNGQRFFYSGSTVTVNPVTSTEYVSISVKYNSDTGGTVLTYYQGSTPTPPPGVLLYTITVLPTTTEITAAEVADGRTQITLKL